MKELYGLSPAQMAEVYCAYVYEDCLDEIRTRLYDGTYGEEMRKKGIPELTVDEINEAAKWLQKNILAYTHWTDGGEDAIDYVLAKRPPKEEPKSIIPTLYGLDWNQMTNVYHAVDTHFMRGEVARAFKDCFYNERLTPEELDSATDFALAIRDDQTEYNNIARDAIQMVIDGRKREPASHPKDLLNDTLKMIGLETNQGFLIDDDEYRGTAFYFDSFGDIYTNGEDEDVYHEYLTLGRILTQYHDKIIPLEG